MTRTVKFKVCAMQSGFAVLFLLTFCAMLAMLSSAAFGIPAGIMLSIAGVAVKLFNAQVIVASLTPGVMIFGGPAAACGSAFLGLAAVKAGRVGAVGTFLRCQLDGGRRVPPGLKKT